MKNVGNLDRKTYIGGSDVAAILGVSPWKTPLDVYMAKISREEEVTDPAKQKIFTRGKRMEPYVIDILSEELGLSIAARGNRYIDKQNNFIAAEIDAETADGRNIEIKTVNPFSAKSWGEQASDEIPVYYAAQAMHGLMVTNREECIFGVLIGSDDFRHYVIKRDEETIQAIRQKEVDFWQCVVNLTPPEPINISDVKALYGRDAGTLIEANSSIERDLIHLRSLKDEAKLLEEKIDQLSDNIKMYFKDAATLTLHGQPVATYKTQSSNRFDTTSFKAKHPDLYEAFVKTSETRVLRIK